MTSRNSSPISAALTIEEYLTERAVSNLPVILVEGDDDSVFFQLLIDELIQYRPEIKNVLRELQIETPHFIRSPDGQSLGNREKVELVCGESYPLDLNGKVAGFVDREFRLFQIENPLQDDLASHKKLGQLIWSRGHSIENYFFEFQTMRRGLRDYSVSSNYDVQGALEVFEVHFEQILRIACALSLAALNLELIGLVTNSLDWQHFRSGIDELSFDFRLWGAHLKQKHKLDEGRIQSLIENFMIWHDIATQSEPSVIRWLCHGHIGEAALWSAYGACVYEVCKQASVPECERRVRSVGKRDRFTAFMTSWIQMALRSAPENTPLECLILLGVQLA